MLGPLDSLFPAGLRPSAFFHRVATARTQRVIAGGPFRGVRYAERAVWGAYVPKLTGTYERELHGIVEQLISAKVSTIVDVGGAEGYYAIGLLHRLGQAKMIVYEQLPEGRAAITDLAHKNGVSERLDLRETCSAESLAQLARETQLDALIMDVEGAEWELLPPETLRALRRTFLLLETHDFAGRRDRAPHAPPRAHAPGDAHRAGAAERERVPLVVADGDARAARHRTLRAQRVPPDGEPVAVVRAPLR